MPEEDDPSSPGPSGSSAPSGSSSGGGDSSGGSDDSGTPVDNSFESDAPDQPDGGEEAIDKDYEDDQQDQPGEVSDGGTGTAPPPEDDTSGAPDPATALAGGGTAAAGMAASMVSAYIQCLDPSLPFPPIMFPYNPGDITINTVGNWTKRLQPATQGPPPHWKGVTPPKVTVKLLLDAFSVPPIPPSVVIEQLKQMVLPTALSVGMGNAMAPFVMFGWGPNIILDMAYISSLSVTYQRYLLGVPVRAEVTITLEAVPLPFPLGATNPTSGGLATRRTRTVVAGDTLASIAFQEYDDPNKWRALAEANKIDDPMRVKTGTVLTVPDRREADNLS